MKNEQITTLFVSPEIVPFRATGGLADVAEALPYALHDENINIIRIMPKYKGIEEEHKLEKAFSFIVEAGRKANIATIYKNETDGLVTYFVGNNDYFERDECYGYGDDDIRFGFFCKAALEMLVFLDIKPDIIHLNDWQTALIGLFLKEEYAELGIYKDIKVMFTIHNLQYQGIFDIGSLNNLNLSTKYFDEASIEYYGKVCFMKAGIVYADLVTTVSKTYAQEIQSLQYGYGLDGLLRKYNNKIKGILNGIYYDKYDPEIDQSLEVNYSVNNCITKRRESKALLQSRLNLPVKNCPVFGVVTRLTEQKGIDLIIYAINQLINLDVQFVIVGSGEEVYEHMLQNLAQKYRDKVSVTIEFNQNLARRIYASTDIFLMPSLFEPCGLSQLYSLRYGSVPVVRETGGLLDTIENYNEETNMGTGFTFTHYYGDEFVVAIKRALNLFDNKTNWNALVKRCMKERFTWSKSAKEYIGEYEKLIKELEQ
jgi:starch synthase